MPSPLFKRTLGNAGALTAGAVTEALLQFVFLLLASRQLGPEDYGFYEYLVGIVTFLVAVVQWGLPVVAVRELAQTPERLDVVFGAMFRISGILALVCFVGGVAASVFGSTTPDRSMAIWLLFLYLLFLPFHFAAIFDAFKLSRWDALGRVVGRTASVLVLIILWQIRGHLTLMDAALCASLNLAVNVAVAWWIAGRVQVKPHLGAAFDLSVSEISKEAQRLAKRAAPIMWANLMTTVYSFSQPVLVKWYSTDLQTGWFGLANRLLFPMLMVRGLLSRLALPILSEAADDPAKFEWRLGRILITLALFFMPVTALAIPAIEILVVPVFGPAYAESVRPLQVLFGHLFFTGVGSIFGTALFSLGYQKTYTWSITIACALNLVAASLLIPRWGAMGASFSVAAAELTTVAITLPALLSVVRIKVWGRMARIMLISLAGFVIYYVLTRGMAVHAIAAFAAELLSLTVLLWVSGEISGEQLRGILDLVRRRRE